MLDINTIPVRNLNLRALLSIWSDRNGNGESNKMRIWLFFWPSTSNLLSHTYTKSCEASICLIFFCSNEFIQYQFTWKNKFHERLFSYNVLFFFRWAVLKVVSMWFHPVTIILRVIYCWHGNIPPIFFTFITYKN